jgi:hypothetical protein
MKKWVLFLGVVFALSFFVSFRVYAAGDVFERASLIGLKRVQVVVEDLAPDILQDGLSRERIKEQVEHQLQRVGISVEQQAEDALYVHLSTVKNEVGLYSYALSLQVLQLVTLFREPGLVTWGTTWSLNQVGSVSPDEVAELEPLIARSVETFIEDYRVANGLVG